METSEHHESQGQSNKDEKEASPEEGGPNTGGTILPQVTTENVD